MVVSVHSFIKPRATINNPFRISTLIRLQNSFRPITVRPGVQILDIPAPHAGKEGLQNAPATDYLIKNV